MKLSALTIKSLVPFVCGDNGTTPYLKGEKIGDLFNQVGILDIYDYKAGGFPGKLSRNQYAWAKLKEINGTKAMKELWELIFDPRNFALDLQKNPETAKIEVNKLIEKDGYRLELINNSYKIIGAEIPDEVEVQVHFEDIQRQIIDQIRAAKFLIWVAVAWFTDRDLMNELYKKKKEGINIRLAIIDDEINSKMSSKLAEYFEIKLLKPKAPFQNIMHHKFCIIDLRTVIHGSYNWTNKAQWNNETISIETSKELAESYAHEFISLLGD